MDITQILPLEIELINAKNRLDDTIRDVTTLAIDEKTPREVLIAHTAHYDATLESYLNVFDLFCGYVLEYENLKPKCEFYKGNYKIILNNTLNCYPEKYNMRILQEKWQNSTN
jgi:hypothetical protein